LVILNVRAPVVLNLVVPTWLWPRHRLTEGKAATATPPFQIRPRTLTVPAASRKAAVFCGVWSLRFKFARRAKSSLCARPSRHRHRCHLRELPRTVRPGIMTTAATTWTVRPKKAASARWGATPQLPKGYHGFPGQHLAPASTTQVVHAPQLQTVIRAGDLLRSTRAPYLRGRYHRRQLRGPSAVW